MSKEKERYKLLIKSAIKPLEIIQGNPIQLSIKIKNIGKMVYPGGELHDIDIEGGKTHYVIKGKHNIPPINPGKTVTILKNEKLTPSEGGLCWLLAKITCKNKESETQFYQGGEQEENVLHFSDMERISCDWCESFWIESRFEHWQKENIKESNKIAEESAKIALIVLSLTGMLFMFQLADFLLNHDSEIEKASLALLASLMVVIVLFLVAITVFRKSKENKVKKPNKKRSNIQESNKILLTRLGWYFILPFLLFCMLFTTPLEKNSLQAPVEGQTKIQEKNISIPVKSIIEDVFRIQGTEWHYVCFVDKGGTIIRDSQSLPQDFNWSVSFNNKTILFIPYNSSNCTIVNADSMFSYQWTGQPRINISGRDINKAVILSPNTDAYSTPEPFNFFIRMSIFILAWYGVTRLIWSYINYII